MSSSYTSNNTSCPALSFVRPPESPCALRMRGGGDYSVQLFSAAGGELQLRWPKATGPPQELEVLGAERPKLLVANIPKPAHCSVSTGVKHLTADVMTGGLGRASLLRPKCRARSSWAWTERCVRRRKLLPTPVNISMTSCQIQTGWSPRSERSFER
jgi:hypothetical protein